MDHPTFAEIARFLAIYAVILGVFSIPFVTD
jgi:hypothetical protein